jgi:thioredoxin 1
VHRFFMVISLLSICISSCKTAAAQAPQASSPAPIEQWRLAVLRGDAAALAQMFITSPRPQIEDVDGKAVTVRSEVRFWTAWKSKGLTDVQVEVSQDQVPQPNVRVIVAQVTLTVNTNGAEQKHYVGMAQGWVQTGDGWRIAYLQRTDAARLRQSLEGKDLYPASADARKEIADAIHAATDTHKRVLLVFGGNWCYDCHVLDDAFHSPEILPVLEKSFEVVHVDIGHMDKNLEIAKQYDVPVDRGVPAIAVLDSDGKLLFSQKRGEFEAARSMAPEDILDFLNKWKPATSKN